jgi:hypothetical protein
MADSPPNSSTSSSHRLAAHVSAICGSFRTLSYAQQAPAFVVELHKRLRGFQFISWSCGLIYALATRTPCLHAIQGAYIFTTHFPNADGTSSAHPSSLRLFNLVELRVLLRLTFRAPKRVFLAASNNQRALPVLKWECSCRQHDYTLPLAHRRLPRPVLRQYIKIIDRPSCTISTFRHLSTQFGALSELPSPPRRAFRGR